MNSIEIALSRKMKEAEPALDVEGSDSKVHQLACQDFRNYVKFTMNLTGDKTDNCIVTQKIDQYFKEKPTETEMFLTVWTSIWLKKWKQRVRLILGKQVSNCVIAPQTNPDSETLWNDLPCKQEMVSIITSALIKNGEICGTQIIAENILKTELTRTKTEETNSKEHLFLALNNALRRARQTAQNVGPSIFVKIDKAYYASASKQRQ